MKKFLTNAPLFKPIRSLEWEELSIFAELGTVTVKTAVKVTRKAGTNATYNETFTVSDGRMYFVVGTPSGETFEDLSKIEAWIEKEVESVWTRLTEVRTFIPDITARKNPVRIGWINTMGGVDYYTFTGSKSSEAIVERSEYSKDLPATFDIKDRTAAVLSANFREEVEVISDFNTETVYQWLAKVMASPEVWVIENGVLIPIIVTSKGGTITSDYLFQFKMKYHKSNDLIVQNG